MLSGRFFVLLSLFVVLTCAGYAAGVLYTTSWPEVAALRTTYTYNWHPRAYTAAEFGIGRGVLLGLASGAGLLLGAFAGTRRGWATLGRGRRAVRQVGRALWASWERLSPGQRQLAGVVLVGLSAARVANSLLAQPFDDAMSYELFVRERLWVLNVVYPYPNNHLLSNTLSWLFYQVQPQFWWAMRLPVLLTSTVASVGWFLALLRQTNFRVALVATTWFGLLNTSLYEASVGRGYWVQVGLGAVGFFALLALQKPPVPGAAARRGVAGAGLVLSGIGGLYAVPTYSFFLLSAYSWLGLKALRRRSGCQLLGLGALGGLTVVGAGLLYAPLLLLSGPALLFHNPFVQPMTPAIFWATLPEAFLVVHRLLGIPLVLGVLVGAGWLGCRVPASQLAPGRGRWLAELTGPSCWFVVLPYLIALVRLIQPPERTFFYKAQYVFILVGLLVDWLWDRAAGRYSAQQRALGLAGGTLLFAAAQLAQMQRQERVWLNSFRWQQGVPTIRWLASQRPGRVLVPDLARFVILRLYAQRDQPGWEPLLDHRPRPGEHYRYLVAAPKEKEVPGGLPLPGPPVYQNDILVIYLGR